MAAFLLAGISLGFSGGMGKLQPVASRAARFAQYWEATTQAESNLNLWECVAYSYILSANTRVQSGPPAS
jgi:hypothetical protein